METLPGRGYEALRRGRWSSVNTDYFLTCCTEGRWVGLANPGLLGAIGQVQQQMESEARWRVRVSTVMPDHVHILATLGAAGELPVVVRLFKGRLAPALRTSGLRWQRGFYDHRMRPGEDRLPVFRYIFMNPYRAGLVAIHEIWPGFYCAPEDWAWIAPLTNEAMPEPEWLR
jgi:REP element-mobilizing transposase RayT